MAELEAKSPCADLLPLEIGKVALTETPVKAITSVAPFQERDTAVSDALKSQTGAGFPAANRDTGAADALVVWSGRGQAMVLGPAIGPIEGAATTDQTDAWACVTLRGAGARDVLARLVPIDLRPSGFGTGHAARTLVGHMTAILMRPEDDRFDIMVFRSMAATLIHELKTSMETVAARG